MDSQTRDSLEEMREQILAASKDPQQIQTSEGRLFAITFVRLIEILQHGVATTEPQKRHHT